VHLPQEVYSIVPFNSYNGIDATYNGVYGDYFYQVRAMYGDSYSKLKLGEGEEFKSDFTSQWGVVLSAGTNTLQLRLNFLQGKTKPKNSPFGALVEALSHTPYGYVGELIDFENQIAGYRSIGINYNADDLELLGELGQVDGGSAIQKYNSWFVYAGYRIDAFLPYVTLGGTQYVKDGALTPNPIPNVGGLAPLYYAVEQTLEASSMSRNTWTFGLRYDVMDNMALKFQYDRIMLKDHINGFILPQTEEGDRNLDVISAALHFVF